MTELDLICVVKAGLLQFRQRAGGAGNQNGAIDQMVGQFSRWRQATIFCLFLPGGWAAGWFRTIKLFEGDRRPNSRRDIKQN
jgi:hypothetical protein